LNVTKGEWDYLTPPDRFTQETVRKRAARRRHLSRGAPPSLVARFAPLGDLDEPAGADIVAVGLCRRLVLDVAFGLHAFELCRPTLFDPLANAERQVMCAHSEPPSSGFTIRIQRLHAGRSLITRTIARFARKFFIARSAQERGIARTENVRASGSIRNVRFARGAQERKMCLIARC